MDNSKGNTQLGTNDKDQRTPRSSETRQDDIRVEEWKPSRLLPTPNPIDGIDFKYVRISSAGEQDNLNHSRNLRDGWEPVKAEECPELGIIVSDRGTDSGNVVLGGMMLCKRDSRIGDRIKGIASEESRRQVASVDQSYLRDQDPKMRKFSDKSTRVSSRVDFGGN